MAPARSERVPDAADPLDDSGGAVEARAGSRAGLRPVERASEGVASSPAVASAGDQDQFFSIPREMIASDVATGLDLYVEVGGRFVLYRAGDQVLDQQSVEKLMRRDVRRFHLRKAQAGLFTQYLADHARTLIQEAGELEQQAAVMRQTAHATLRLAFERLDDPKSYERVRMVSDVAVERLAEDLAFLPQLVEFAGTQDRLLTRSTNTAAYAIALAARQRGMSDAEMYSIGLGAMVHDLGLASISSALDHGKGLSEVEQRIVDRHSRRGHDVLLRAGIDDPIVLDIVRDHHGVMEGRRPTLPAQIVALADTFDQLTNRTDHGQPIGPFAALYQMRTDVGRAFSMELLRDFVLLLGGVPVANADSPVAPLSRRSAVQRPGGLLNSSGVPIFADPADMPASAHQPSTSRGREAKLFAE